MGLMSKVRISHIAMMKRTCITLGHILHNVTPEEARTLRDLNDGDKGWTVLEVAAHLADFDGFFYERAAMMLDEVYPHLPAFDHEALAIERRYNEQNLEEVYARFEVSRRRSIDFFKNLTDEQWNRAGVHPEYGHFTLTDAVMQVGMHDLNHMEQITRILRQKI